MNTSMSEIAVRYHAKENTAPQVTVEQTISEVPLRVKGFLAFTAVVIYAVLFTTYTFIKKAELVDEFERLQSLYKIEDDLRQVDATAFHVVMAIFMNSSTNDPRAQIQRFQENFDLLRKRNAELTMRYPLAGVNLSGIEQALAKAAAHPSSAGLAVMNSELLKVKIQITQHIDESIQEQKQRRKLSVCCGIQQRLQRCCSD